MKKNKIGILTFALLLANIMAGLEGTIISTAMPTIVADLKGITLMNWVFTIYLLLMAIGTPIWGKISDRIGRKKSFVFGVTIFIVGSFLEGLSPNMTFMIFARALMGIGAGGMISTPFIIFAEIYPPEKRASIFGLTAAFGGISSVSGPIIGGLIIEKLNWHWVFYINVPIGILSIILVQIFFNEEVKKINKSIDVVGGLLLSLGLLTLMLGLQEVGHAVSLSFGIIIYFIISGISLFLFVKVEKKAEDPIIPVMLLKNREMLIKNFIAFATMGYYISLNVYIPMWAQGIMATSAIIAGMTQIPIAGLWYSGSRIAAKRIKNHSANSTILIGLIIALAGAFTLVFAKQSASYWLFIIVGTLFGIAFGMLLATSQVAVTQIVAPENLSAATTLNRLFNTLGQTVMLSIYGVVFNTSIHSGILQNSSSKITIDMINQLSDAKVAEKFTSNSLELLRRIVFNGIHMALVAGMVLLLTALALTILDIRLKDKLKRKRG